MVVIDVVVKVVVAVVSLFKYNSGTIDNFKSEHYFTLGGQNDDDDDDDDNNNNSNNNNNNNTLLINMIFL
jgi:hypothetical protein